MQESPGHLTGLESLNALREFETVSETVFDIFLVIISLFKGGEKID
jgi:hypothetical protein